MNISHISYVFILISLLLLYIYIFLPYNKSFNFIKNIVMKKLSTFSALALAFLMTSCKSTQAPTDFQAFMAYQQMMQQNQQQNMQNQQQPQQIQQQTQQPRMQKRQDDECITLANTQSDALRAYGEGSSYIENIALSNAEADAVTRLVGQLKTAVLGARETYANSNQLNQKKMDEQRVEGLIKQFIAGSSGYRIIKTSIYDVNDGTIKCYVCIEQRMSKNEMSQKLTNYLSNEDVLGIEFDKERFANSIKDELEMYKREQQEQGSY